MKGLLTLRSFYPWEKGPNAGMKVLDEKKSLAPAENRTTNCRLSGPQQLHYPLLYERRSTANFHTVDTLQLTRGMSYPKNRKIYLWCMEGYGVTFTFIVVYGTLWVDLYLTCGAWYVMA